MAHLQLLADPFTTPRHHQNILLGIYPDDSDEEDLLSHWRRNPRREKKMIYSPYLRSLKLKNKLHLGKSPEIIDKDHFKVNVDVKQFTPDEITVKATGNNTITVEAKHEERPDDHGSIYRHFVRRYLLPKGHDIEKVQSRLSSDGVLTITAPKVDKSKPREREIQVELTHEPSPTPMEHKKVEQGEKK